MNVEFHGLLLKEKNDRTQFLNSAMGKLCACIPKEEWADCAVTIVPSHSSDNNGRLAPFIRVYTNQRSDFLLVKKAFKGVRMPGAGMKTFVECIVVDDCFIL